MFIIRQVHIESNPSKLEVITNYSTEHLESIFRTPFQFIKTEDIDSEIAKYNGNPKHPNLNIMADLLYGKQITDFQNILFLVTLETPRVFQRQGLATAALNSVLEINYQSSSPFEYLLTKPVMDSGVNFVKKYGFVDLRYGYYGLPMVSFEDEPEQLEETTPT
jgi:hypothetical protein